MSDYVFHPDLNALLDEVPEDSILSRTIFRSPHLKGILFSFAPGQELSEHTAAKPAVLHFLRGKGTLTLGEETFQVKPGSWAFMPAQLSHSVVAETPLDMFLELLEGA
jgi:quercetin dioxygenase-like cupin family protein